MTFKVGPSKPLDEISAEDAQTHPIWLWVWEVGPEDQADDETWQCPVLDTKDVSEAMTEPVITLITKDSNLIASASYMSQSEQLEGIAVWQGSAWVGIGDAALPTPITLVAIPTIRGIANVEFICNQPAEDRASRAG
jgi:hypothetical protein